MNYNSSKSIFSQTFLPWPPRTAILTKSLTSYYLIHFIFFWLDITLEPFWLPTALSITVGFSLYSLGSDDSTENTSTAYQWTYLRIRWNMLTESLPSNGYMRTHIENIACNICSIVACLYCGRCPTMGLLHCWLHICCGLDYRVAAQQRVYASQCHPPSMSRSF
jgi:hypothetical protein